MTQPETAAARFDVGAQAFTGVGVRFSGHKKLK